MYFTKNLGQALCENPSRIQKSLNFTELFATHLIDLLIFNYS